MSARRWRGSSRRAVSWLGIVALVGGITLIQLYYDHPHLSRNANPLVPMVYLGAGCTLILWGLRALVGEVIRLLGRGQRPAQRYRVHMPREALIYMLILVVLCVGALVGRSNMLMLVFGLMAGPFVLNGQVTLAILKRLEAMRRLPEHAVVGESFSVKLGLVNRKRLLSAWMVTAEDMVQSPREQLQPAVLFTCVPPRSRREGAYEICPAHRGLYEFGPVRVMSRFPLGLMERSFELGRTESLIVYPRIGRMTARWRRASETGELHSDLELAQVGIADDEFHRLREYRGGDNPRAIHWRTSARRNELTVREYQQCRQQDLLLVLDLWLPARSRRADLERVELAVSFAASICVDQMQSAADSQVGLVVCGKNAVGDPNDGPGLSMTGLLERLALAEAGTAADLASAVRVARQPMGTRARCVLVTTRPRSETLAVLSAETAGPPAGGLELIEARPDELAEYIEFEEGRGRAT